MDLLNFALSGHTIMLRPDFGLSHYFRRIMFHFEMCCTNSTFRVRVPSTSRRANPLTYFAGFAVGGRIPFSRKYTACAL